MEPSVNMLTATFLWIVIGCWSIVVSAEVTITRDSRNDLMQFSNCSQNIDDFCHQFNADPYGNDGRLCSCQCKRDYVMYRDPDVNISFGYEPGKRECVWWSHNHEGCTGFRRGSQRTNRRPLVIDLTRSGRVTRLRAELDDNCLGVVPYVKYPGKNEWIQANISFTLRRTSRTRYTLQWEPNSGNQYVYQGLAMRLDVCGRNPTSNCIIAKIDGTYTDPEKCKRRTVDGRCCVFPFSFNGRLYNDCYEGRSLDERPWCPVSVKFNRHSSSRRWRAECLVTTSSTVVPTPSASSPSLSNTGNQFSTEILPSSASTIKSTMQNTATATPSFSRYSTSSLRTSSITLGDPAVGASSASSGNRGTIIGVVVGLVGLLMIVVVATVFLHRRKRKRDISREPDVASRTNEGFAQGSNESHPENSSSAVQRSSDQALPESSEMSGEGPSDTEGRRHDNRNHLTKPKSGDTHFFDTAGRENSQNDDYAVIATIPKQAKIKDRSSPSADDSSKHFYNVLERENDLLRNPEPVDNDKVFVEANPLYGTNDSVNTNGLSHPDMPEGVNEKEVERNSSRHTYDVPQTTDKKP